MADKAIEELEEAIEELEAENHQLRYQLRRLVNGYLIMCDGERDALVDEAEQILGNRGRYAYHLGRENR